MHGTGGWYGSQMHILSLHAQSSTILFLVGGNYDGKRHSQTALSSPCPIAIHFWLCHALNFAPHSTIHERCTPGCFGRVNNFNQEEEITSFQPHQAD